MGALFTVGIHVLIVALLLAVNSPEPSTQLAPINVSVISDTPQKNQPLEAPVKPRLDQPKIHIPQPEVAVADTAEPSVLAVTAASPASSTAPVAVTPTITQPVFDADYLNNPAPAYPPFSRRMREQGVVYVRVLVSPEGTPEQIEIKRSSGSARLDEAALVAVKRWRFVPARRGSQSVAAWVVVPIAFSLTA